MIMTTEAIDVVDRYERGERTFRELEFSEGASFKGQNLSGAIFERCWFMSVDFSNAVLRRTSFREAHLKCCDFTGADLTGADLRDSGIDGATFTNARLNDARVEGATAYGYVFKDGDELKI
jgi:uncharacterized protein YjbI with pentapeptide repeats